MSDRPQACIDCGAALAPGYPSMLCPRCMWAGNIADEAPAAVPSGLASMRIPGHDVLEEIARGGMGVVYRARERETQRTVALKMLRPRLADEEGMRERFRMEASSVAALEHPSILPVYRVDEADDMPFFTMKLAGGGTLASRTDSLRGRWRDIAALVITLADAVLYAHQRGVLHRDVKPANILFDDEDKPYLTDFGLVKLIDSVSELTGSQNFLGTPHYSAPEVAAANASVATVASDVWSLGAVLYELLTGQLPFEADGLAALLRKILDDSPAPFPAAAGVPRDLRVITLKCLQKDPAARYQSAGMLAADLRAWMDGRPITARSASLPERVAAWAKRNPLPAAMAAALAVSLTILAVLLLREYRASQRAAEQSRLAETASRKAETVAREAEAVSLLDETRAKLREGQWVDRKAAIDSVLRSHALRPSADARNVLLSLLALPQLEQTGTVPYTKSRPVYFNGDLTQYVTVEKNATAIRDTATAKVIHTLPEQAHNNWPPGPLSADGSILLLRGANRTAAWNVAQRKPLGVFPPGGGFLYISGDNSRASAGLAVADLRTSPATVSLQEHPEFSSRGLSPDGKFHVVVHPDRLVMKLLDAATGALLQEYYEPASRMVHGLAWSQDSQSFCTGTVDGKIARWRLDSPSPDWILPGHTDGVDTLALFDHDRHLITQGRDGQTKIWDLRTQHAVFVLPWGGVRVAASTDGTRIAVDCPPERKSRLYRFTPPPLCTLVRLPSSQVFNSYLQGEAAVIPAPDGNSFAVTSGYDLHIMDREGALTNTFRCTRCDGIAPDPVGAGFVRMQSFGGSHTSYRCPPDWTRAWDDEKLLFGKWTGPDACMVSQPGTRSLFTGAGDRIMVAHPLPEGGVRMVDVTPPSLPKGGDVSAIAVSKSGELMAWAGLYRAGGTERAIHIFRTGSKEEVAAFPAGFSTTELAFTSDGDALLAGDFRHVSCYDLQSKSMRWQIPHRRPPDAGNYAPVRIAVAGTAGTIAAALTPETVSLLDAATGAVRRTFQHPLDRIIRGIGLSPDGTRLVCVGSYLVQIWRLDTAEEELARHGISGAL